MEPPGTVRQRARSDKPAQERDWTKSRRTQARLLRAGCEIQIRKGNVARTSINTTIFYERSRWHEAADKHSRGVDARPQAEPSL
jgi:hypothetical protein